MGELTNMHLLLEESTFLNPVLYILLQSTSFPACTGLVIRVRLWANGNLAFSFPGLAAMCWPPSVPLPGACICLEQVPDPVQLQHSQHRYGWEALGRSHSPPSFPGVPICVPRTSSATWHLSLDESGPFFVRRRTRLPATPHSACCWATMRWRIAALHNPLLWVCVSVCVWVCVCILLSFPCFGQIRGPSTNCKQVIMLL